MSLTLADVLKQIDEHLAEIHEPERPRHGCGRAYDCNDVECAQNSGRAAGARDALKELYWQLEARASVSGAPGTRRPA